MMLIHCCANESYSNQPVGGTEVLQVADVPDPVPAAGQVLVRVKAGGINFADIMTVQGGYPGAPRPPLVVGREFSGVREEDGQHVMGIRAVGRLRPAHCDPD
jgi:NADPH2:quinone reductase